MAQEFTKLGPPRVRGLSVDPAPKRDPLQFLASMLGNAMSGGPGPEQQGMAIAQEIMSLAAKMAKTDPRLAPLAEQIQRIIIRGPSQADGSPGAALGESGIAGPVSAPPFGMPPNGPR